MEGKEDLNLTIKADEAPQSFRIEPRVENSGQFVGSAAPPHVTAAAPSSAGTDGRKKRGRPRKYAGAADGSVTALSPMPISASIPLAGEFPTWQQNAKRPVESTKKKQKLDFEAQGKTMASSVGGAFTPHVMTVNKGEDVTMKIISFSQQGSRAICILAANGTISNVTLRQPDSSGGTLTYEGRFEILSLTGSFMPSDNGLTKSRSGGMSVSLAGPDGRVLGGGLAGMLIAAGPIQVVIGSFLTGQQQQEQQQKPKKQKYEHTIAFSPVPTNPIPEERYETAYNAPKSNLNNSTSFHGDNSASMNTMHGGFKITVSDTNHPMPGEDSRDRSHEITC